MKYKYTITKEGGEAETMEAMSWKKLFKSLLIKYPKFSGWCSYINKKGHVQARAFREGKEIHSGGGLSNTERCTHCVICGCTPKPDEWSPQVENCCLDCG